MTIGQINMATAVLCGVLACALFSLYCFSDRKYASWLTLPWWVRYPQLAAGAALAVRSANLFDMGGADRAGSTNFWGLIGTLLITLAISTLAAWVVFGATAPRTRQRAQWAFGEMKRDPELVPVLVPKEDVPKIAEAAGMIVNPGKVPAP